MKRIRNYMSTIAAMLLSSQFVVFSQQSETGNFLELTTGEVLYGLVEHVDHRLVNSTFYKKIRLTDTRGKKKRFKTSLVEAFQVDGVRYEGYWLNQTQEKIRFVNPRYDIDPKDGERHFLKVISKGNLSHYEYEWWEQGEARMMSMDLLKRTDDGYFIRATQGLFGLKRKVLTTYFDDCPELQEKIKEQEFKKVAEVSDFYNGTCAD